MQTGRRDKCALNLLLLNTQIFEYKLVRGAMKTTKSLILKFHSIVSWLCLAEFAVSMCIL